MIKIIGLTGGIGSGKTVVASMLREEGIAVLDTDAIGHELLKHDRGVRESIREAFGDDVLQEGIISRDKLGAKVFHQEKMLQALNSIMHPAIINTVVNRCVELDNKGIDMVVVEAALFANDCKKEAWLDGLILVLSDLEIRKKRLETTRQMRVDDIHKRIQVQSDPDKKSCVADWIIINNGTLEELRDDVHELAVALHEFAYPKGRT